MPDTPKVDLQLQRRLLPIYTARDALIREIKSNVSCVVVGETGSGKTTQIPQVRRVDRDVGGTDNIYGGTEVSFSYMSFGHIVSAWGRIGQKGCYSSDAASPCCSYQHCKACCSGEKCGAWQRGLIVWFVVLEIVLNMWTPVLIVIDWIQCSVWGLHLSTDEAQVHDRWNATERGNIRPFANKVKSHYR